MKHATSLTCLALALNACSNALQPPGSLPRLLPLPSATASPAVAALVSTPVIIPSPTYTPTPVTHVVQQGDTLVGIAVRYGVSVEALQAANQGVQPEYLTIGAVLTIPSPDSGDSGIVGGLPTPTPVPVTLGHLSCHSTVSGALYCFVEARNLGATALTNLAARITLAGVDGLPLASDIAYAPLNVIPPGGAAPLAVLFPSTPAGFAASNVSVLSASPLDLSDQAAAHYILLEVPFHSGLAAGDEWTVTGRVRNPSAAAVTSAWLTLTLYDVAGDILGYRQQALSGGLAAGATRDFTISTSPLGGAVNYYLIAAEGRP